MVGDDKKELIKKARNLRNHMTRAEIILWSRLKSRQIDGYKFRRQQPILDYIVDFYCHDLRLIIEVDGEIHSLPEKIKSDRIRDNMLRINGFNVIHFANIDIETDLKSSINKIKSFISKTLSPSQREHSGSAK